MFEILLFSTIGCVYGLVIGLLPGASVGIGMVLTYPFLLHLHPHETIAFYICMATSVQYFGGASASLLGIPTEVTCLPSVKEGYALVNRGAISEALSSGAISSFIGSVIAVALSVIIFFLGNNYSLLFNFKLQLTLLLLTCVLTVIGQDKKITAVILLVIGYIMGLVGVNAITHKQFLTFNSPHLISGIPLIIVLVYLYGLPELIKMNSGNYNFNLVEKLKLKLVVPLTTIIRSSFVGFICGFIPMLGTVISSNLSYSLTKLIHRKDYNFINGDARGLASSDAGHNAGLVASMIPLFCFAVPILPSEYILYEITNSRGLVFNLQWLYDNYLWMFGIFLFANIFGFITSWPLAIKLVKFIVSKMLFWKIFGIILMIFSVLLVGYSTNQLGFYCLLSAIFFPIGYVFRRLDGLPLVLGFLISQQFDSTLRIVYSLTLGE